MYPFWVLLQVLVILSSPYLPIQNFNYVLSVSLFYFEIVFFLFDLVVDLSSALSIDSLIEFSFVIFEYQRGLIRKNEKKKKNSKNVAVFQEVSDEKQNPCIPEKMSFLTPKKNSFSVRSDHFNWKDLFLSVGGGEKHVSAKSRLSGELVFPPVVVSDGPTFPTHETSELRLIKNDAYIFQHLAWETWLFLLVRENVPLHSIVVEPYNKVGV